MVRVLKLINFLHPMPFLISIFFKVCHMCLHWQDRLIMNSFIVFTFLSELVANPIIHTTYVSSLCPGRP